MPLPALSAGEVLKERHPHGLKAFPDIALNSKVSSSWHRRDLPPRASLRIAVCGTHCTLSLECLFLALNVVCCETAIRLESGPKRKWPAGAQNVADDPERKSRFAGRGIRRLYSGFELRDQESRRGDDITIPPRAFAQCGLVPSADVPARREIGQPSVGCCCVRAPGTARRAVRAARPAASRAPVR
jgi:hypothetical protein